MGCGLLEERKKNDNLILTVNDQMKHGSYEMGKMAEFRF